MKKEHMDALDLMERAVGNDPSHCRGMAVEDLNGDLAQLIFDAREATGVDPVPDDLDFRDLTVRQLAELLWELGVGLQVEPKALSSYARNETSALPAQRKTG
ncbi:MAG: hypothetical protein ABI743_02055 [bacterium]